MKPNFSTNLFWDIDVNELDYKSNFPFILSRVLDYGTWKDWKELSRYYTKQQIKATAINLRSLFPKSLNFISFFTETPKEEFRCYKNKQLNQTHWNF